MSSKKEVENSYDFYKGICVALSIVTLYDNVTLWKEIIQSIGGETEQKRLLKHAKKHGQWSIAGFNKYYKTELKKTLINERKYSDQVRIEEQFVYYKERR